MRETDHCIYYTGYHIVEEIWELTQLTEFIHFCSLLLCQTISKKSQPCEGRTFLIDTKFLKVSYRLFIVLAARRRQRRLTLI